MTRMQFLVNRDEITEAFIEWERTLRANPEDFLDEQEIAEFTPEENGALSAEYFIALLREIQDLPD